MEYQHAADVLVASVASGVVGLGIGLFWCERQTYRASVALDRAKLQRDSYKAKWLRAGERAAKLEARQRPAISLTDDQFRVVDIIAASETPMDKNQVRECVRLQYEREGRTDRVPNVTPRLSELKRMGLVRVVREKSGHRAGTWEWTGVEYAEELAQGGGA